MTDSNGIEVRGLVREYKKGPRAVDGIDQDPEIGSYVEMGGQLAYRISPEVELFVAGRNLIHRTHEESNDPGAGQRARRSIYAGARAQF